MKALTYSEAAAFQRAAFYRFAGIGAVIDCDRTRMDRRRYMITIIHM